MPPRWALNMRKSVSVSSSRLSKKSARPKRTVHVMLNTLINHALTSKESYLSPRWTSPILKTARQFVGVAGKMIASRYALDTCTESDQGR